MRYESYFRDPQFRKQADKIMAEFFRVKKTLVKTNIGLKTVLKEIENDIRLLKENPSENNIEKVKEDLFDLKMDAYALIEKGDSIIVDMKINYFKKSPKIEYKNKEVIEEHRELVKQVKEKLAELEELYNSVVQSASQEVNEKEEVNADESN